MELDGADDGAEAPELIHPVAQRGLGHDHDVGPLDAAVLVQVGQQADGLQRLTQALHATQHDTAQRDMSNQGV